MPGEHQSGPEREREQERQTRRLWQLSSMGGELAFGIVGMVLLGLGIDYLAGSKPIAVIICTIVGVIGSGYNFIRQALAITRQSAAPPRRRDPS